MSSKANQYPTPWAAPNGNTLPTTGSTPGAEKLDPNNLPLQAVEVTPDRKSSGRWIGRSLCTGPVDHDQLLDDASVVPETVHFAVSNESFSHFIGCF